MDAEVAPEAEAWRQLLERVSQSYVDGDEDRYLMERSLEISSREMQSLYEAVRKSSESRIANEHEKLRRSEERYRRLVQAAPGVILSLSADGSTITSLNRAFEKLTGWTCDEWLGRPLASLIHPQDLAHADQRVQQALRSESTPSFELRFATNRVAGRASGATGAGRASGATGEYLDAELTLTRLVEGDKVTGILGIARDVTDRKRVQQALKSAKEAAEAANLAKSDFLANMSHEIRTPLNAVIGLTSLLLDSRLEPELAGYVETIRSSGDSVLALINDILDFSKIEAGKLQLEEQAFGIRECLRGPIDLVAAEAEDKGLRLVTTIHEGCPAVVAGDVARVQQILVNLLSNAVKFTQEGEVEIAVRSRRVDGERLELEFAVSDTGVGISRDKVGKIFRSFSQADASTSRRYGGTGLGLAISRRLAELMGGRIWVESQQGQGSTFRFTIQARPADPALEPVAGSQRDAESIDHTLGQKMPLRILVAEDNAVNQRVALLLLQRMGYRADLAADGREVLDCLERQTYDVVLMDVQMPELDGLEATRRILERWGPDRRPRIIAMTAAAIREDRERCFAAGMDGFVSKPIRIAELQAALVPCRPAESGGVRGEHASAPKAVPSSPASESGGLKVSTDLKLLGAEILGEIIHKFLDNAEQLEAAIRRAIEESDAEALKMASHSLKGSSATVGAARMADICKELEVGARQGSLEGAEDRLRELSAELGRVAKFFRRQARKSAG